MAYLLAGFIGGLVICYLVSRLILRLVRSLQPPVRRILLAHVITLGIATVIGGYGFANGGPPQFVDAFLRYVLPVVVLAVIDLVRESRAKAAPPAVPS